MASMTRTKSKTAFLAYVPFTGLGLYGGFRGNRWLRNRIKIFKQFVVASLVNQSDQDFTLWISWRPEERNNKYVKELAEWLRDETKLNYAFTFGGLCFWDDKYPDDLARNRLITSLHHSMPDLFDVIGQADEVVMLIQPSDDLYEKNAVKRIKEVLHNDRSIGAVTYQQGFHTNYLNKEVRDYNPTTNPPFFAIRFPKDVFIEPVKHINHTGPYKSHEYIGDKLKLHVLQGRGFMVGSHSENISTHFNHPFSGRFAYDGAGREEILSQFGILDVPVLELPKSFRRDLMRKLPHDWQKKLRYVFGEKLFNLFYQFIRN